MEIRYTAEHEWVSLEGTSATVGITDHAQRLLGDLVFVQLPEVGTAVSRGGGAGVVESVKAASDIYAPLSGAIAAVNAATVENPGLINADPQGEGWLFKLTIADPAEFAALMDEATYRQLVQ